MFKISTKFCSTNQPKNISIINKYLITLVQFSNMQPLCDILITSRLFSAFVDFVFHIHSQRKNDFNISKFFIDTSGKIISEKCVKYAKIFSVGQKIFCNNMRHNKILLSQKILIKTFLIFFFLRINLYFSFHLEYIEKSSLQSSRYGKEIICGW